MEFTEHIRETASAVEIIIPCIKANGFIFGERNNNFIVLLSRIREMLMKLCQLYREKGKLNFL